MSKSKIEWTESTWNPVSGCTKISNGCENCYVERMAKRLQAMGTKWYEDGFKVTLHPESLEKPLKMKRPERLEQISNKLNWMKNMWMGDYVDRVDYLRNLDIKVKFFSVDKMDYIDV